MEEIITDIKKANEAGNSRAVWEAVKYLGGSSKRPAPRQPSKSPAGEEIRSSEELAEAWRAFCADTKFACAEAESRRPDYEDIDDASERENDVPTMKELELCLKALNAGSISGRGIPGIRLGKERPDRVHQAMLARGALTDNTWLTLGRGTLITTFKRGRKDDYGNYRLINLLIHNPLLLRLYILSTTIYSRSFASQFIPCDLC